MNAMHGAGIVDHALALAGLFQSVSLVQRVALEGTLDDAAFDASIGSVLRIDAPSPEAVFGGRERLALGLRTLCAQIGAARTARDMDLSRYAFSLMFLERKLARRGDLMRKLRDGIEVAAAQSRHFPCTHDAILARLAATYLESVSTLRPRIVVTGEARFLECAANADRVRSLLLAGIRATVLWRQLGGSRLRLLLGRKRLVSCVQVLLSEMEA